MCLPSPGDDTAAAPGEDDVDERRRIVQTLVATHWNKSASARSLHWSRVTLYRKMAKYHIDAVATEAPADRG